jgi:phosphoribosylglycinamide formyltransferase 1
MTYGKKRCVVLISGRGSNLAALLKAAQAEDYPAIIVGVVSNKAGAAGLTLAYDAGIPTVVVASSPEQDRAAYDAQLKGAIDQFTPDLLVLAGFMRILTPAFVHHYAGRIINIHPSLLPSFTGLHTHQRALDAGVLLHGCTVHFVTAELDHGPMIAQAAVPVFGDDNAQTLSARVLHEEHRLYPLAVRWFAEGRLTIDGQRVLLADELKNPASLLAPYPG